MKSYFAYTRVSTVKQGEHGSSLIEQKTAIEAYARRGGLQIAGWYEEMETAAHLGRRMFNRMLAELEKGRASGVIIHKIDRSARNLKDWAHLGELIDRGIEVHFAHESLDMTSRGGRLAADIQAVVAADFIRNLRDEVRKGFYGRLKQGFYPLPAPIGYLDRGAAKAKDPDPANAPLVREAFALYATGGYTLQTLRAELARRGLRGKSGRPFSKQALAKLLHNPFYIGLMRIQRTGETFQGVHPPLVTKALFARVQAVSEGRVFARTRRHAFALRRLLRCGACAHALTGELQKGRVYYRCHTRDCCGARLREDQAVQALAELYTLLRFSPEEMRDLGDLAKTALEDQASSREQRLAELRRGVGLCDERLQRLTDAIIDGLLDKDAYETRKRALLSERRALLDAIEQPDPLDFTPLLQKFELANTALLRLDSVVSEEKRDVVKKTVSNWVVEGKTLAITLAFPFDEIARWRLSRDGGPYRTEFRTLLGRGLVRNDLGDVPQVPHILRRTPDGRWRVSA